MNIKLINPRIELNSLMICYLHSFNGKDTNELVAGLSEVGEQCGEVCALVLLMCCCPVVVQLCCVQSTAVVSAVFSQRYRQQTKKTKREREENTFTCTVCKKNFNPIWEFRLKSPK